MPGASSGHMRLCSRYQSQLQGNSCHLKRTPWRAPAASSTRTPSGTTSRPMPSPGMTAMECSFMAAQYIESPHALRGGRNLDAVVLGGAVVRRRNRLARALRRPAPLGARPPHARAASWIAKDFPARTALRCFRRRARVVHRPEDCLCPGAGTRARARAAGARRLDARGAGGGIGRAPRGRVHRCAHARSVLCGARERGAALARGDSAAMPRAAGCAPAGGRWLGRMRQRLRGLRRPGVCAYAAAGAPDRGGGRGARRAALRRGRGRRCGARRAAVPARQGGADEGGAGGKMSAVLKDVPQLGRMREPDLAEVMAIEEAIYSHPWTRGNFSDSLRAGYECRTLRLGAELLGYFVLMAAAGEAHLLNLSVAARHQRSGHGAQLLAEAMSLARGLGARGLFLEVRPSNGAAQALYTRFGFRKVGVRRAYYPAHFGREDALVLTLPLQ